MKKATHPLLGVLFVILSLLNPSIHTFAEDSVDLWNYETIIKSLGDQCSVPMPGVNSKVKPEQLKSHWLKWKDLSEKTIMAVEGKQGSIYNTAVVVFPIGKPDLCEIWYLAWQPDEKQMEEESGNFYDRQISQIFGWWVPENGKEPFLVLEDGSVGEHSATYSIIILDHGRTVGRIDGGYSPAGEGSDSSPSEDEYRCNVLLSTIGEMTVNCRHSGLPDEKANIKNFSYCWNGSKVEICK